MILEFVKKPAPGLRLHAVAAAATKAVKKRKLDASTIVGQIWDSLGWWLDFCMVEEDIKAEA